MKTTQIFCLTTTQKRGKHRNINNQHQIETSTTEKYPQNTNGQAENTPEGQNNSGESILLGTPKHVCQQVFKIFITVSPGQTFQSLVTRNFHPGTVQTLTCKCTYDVSDTNADMQSSVAFHYIRIGFLTEQ